MEGFKSGVKNTMLVAVLLREKRSPSGRQEWKQEVSRFDTTYDTSIV